jgi:hypothetical protein
MLNLSANRYSSVYRQNSDGDYDVRELAGGWVVIAEIGEFRGQSLTDAMNKFRAEVERHFKEDR